MKIIKTSNTSKLDKIIFVLCIWQFLTTNAYALANELDVDAIGSFIERNLKVKLAKLDLDLAKIEQSAALGPLDTQLGISAYR